MDATTPPSPSQSLEQHLGEQVRQLRIAMHTDQASLAAQAHVALNALKRLERGKGCTLRTLVKVTHALGRSEWLTQLMPELAQAPPGTRRVRASLRKRPNPPPQPDPD